MFFFLRHLWVRNGAEFMGFIGRSLRSIGHINHRLRNAYEAITQFTVHAQSEERVEKRRGGELKEIPKHCGAGDIRCNLLFQELLVQPVSSYLSR